MDHKKKAFPSREAALLAAITIAAFAVRSYFMRYHPVMAPDYDGAEYIYLAKRVFGGGGEFCSIFIPPGFPFLISLALPFFASPQAAGMFISAACGSGLCIAVYLLTKELFDGKAALLAALFTASFGQLIVASTWVMAEMPFALCLFMGLYAGAVFQRRKDTASALWFGGLFGVAYQMRPEALIIFFMTSAVLLLSLIREDRAGRVKAAKLLALATVLMLAICLPYLLYLRESLGRWTVSGKVEYNLAKGSEAGNKALNTGALDYMSAHLADLWGRYKVNFVVLEDRLKVEFPTVLLLLSASGLAASPFMGGRRPLGLVYPMVPFCFMFMLPLFFIDERIISPYFPALLIWAAAGASLAERKLFGLGPLKPAARFHPLMAAVGLAVSVYYVTSLGAFYGSPQVAQFNQELSVRYLDTGQWLKANSKPSDKVFSRELLLVFYSGREYIHLGDYTPERLLGMAREKGARFVIVDGVCVKKRPQLSCLLAPFYGQECATPGFREVYANFEGEVVIYEVEP